MQKVTRLGEKLRKLRRERELTLVALARRLNMSSHSYFSDLENGKKNPSLSLIVTLANFFEVTTDQLLRDDLDV